MNPNYLWVNPLFAIKIGHLRSLETDALENTIWEVALSEGVTDNIPAQDFYETAEGVHNFLVDNIVREVDNLPEESPLDCAMLGLDIQAKVDLVSGVTIDITHVACFHYEGDTLHILIVHLTHDELQSFIAERKLGPDLLQ